MIASCLENKEKGGEIQDGGVTERQIIKKSDQGWHLARSVNLGDFSPGEVHIVPRMKVSFSKQNVLGLSQTNIKDIGLILGTDADDARIHLESST